MLQPCPHPQQEKGLSVDTLQGLAEAGKQPPCLSQQPDRTIVSLGKACPYSHFPLNPCQVISSRDH